MAAWLDNVKFNPTAGGTTDWTYSSAVTGYQSPAAAGVVNGSTYRYFAISADLTQWEIGYGTYNTSTGVLSRGTVIYNSAGTTAKVNFTTTPVVAVVAILEDLVPAQASFGLGMANGTLVAPVASNILTVAVKTLAGNDPSPADPVFFYIRDATSANGDYVWRVVTSALSINTVAVGATLGTANGTPFRLWVNAFDNAGTVVLGLFQSVGGAPTPNYLTALDETSPVSTVAISGTATAYGTHYTLAALTARSFRILGYVEYGSGLTTAGTYATAPTKVQLFGPGVKKPGDVVQAAYGMTVSSANTTATTFQNTTLTTVIAPTSTPNIISARGDMNTRTDANGEAPRYSLARNATTFGSIANVMQNQGEWALIQHVALHGWDMPASTAQQTYRIMFASSSGYTVYANDRGQSSIEVQELMV